MVKTFELLLRKLCIEII